MLEVRETTKMLKTHPNLGPIDPLFNDRPKTYRSVIINGLSKMVYFIEDDIDLTLSHIHERYDPGATAERVEALSEQTGLAIYRILAGEEAAP